jgi:hypothetical protein
VRRNVFGDDVPKILLTVRIASCQMLSNLHVRIILMMNLVQLCFSLSCSSRVTFVWRSENGVDDVGTIMFLPVDLEQELDRHRSTSQAV